MIKRTLVAVTLTTAIFIETLPIPAAARSVKLMAPVTSWSMDWSPTTCTLRRGYGDQGSLDVLMMERFGPSDTFQLTVISDEFRNYEQGDPLMIRFGEGEPIQVPQPLPGKVKDGKASIFVSSASLASAAKKAMHMKDKDSDDDDDLSVTPAMEAAATSVGFDFHGRTIQFQTGSLAKPFEAMRKCTDDLVKSWGLDPAQQARRAAFAKPLTRPSTWTSGYAYPPSMAAAGQQALVNFRLSVDEKGVPTACEVQRSFNNKVFDDLTCTRIMQRARFSPALDENSKPIASYYLNRVVWVVAQG